MNNVHHGTRSYRHLLHGRSFSSAVGYGTRATNFVHRCLTTNSTASTIMDDLRVMALGPGAHSPHSTHRQFHNYYRSFQNLPCHFRRLRLQQLQVRHFVFDSRKARKAKRKKDPFKVLKIPKGSLYKDVKATFLRIAMNNHPDMHTDGLSEKEQEAMRDKFIAARMAFEALEEDPEDGKAVLAEELIDRESNFDSWFHNETGLKNPFDVDMDPETMKEVAEMTEKMGGKQGMERDGGMWALARMVTSAVKKGGDAASILRLESGDIKQRRGPDGSLRRPRKR